MPVPLDAAKAITEVLGAEPRQYRTATRLYTEGVWTETDCLYWPLAPDTNGLQARLAEHQRLSNEAKEHYLAGRLHEVERLLEQVHLLHAPVKPRRVAGVEVYAFEELMAADPYRGVHRGWWQARAAVSGRPVALYLGPADAVNGGRRYQSAYELGAGQVLVAAPVADQLEVLRVEETNGANFNLDTGAVIAGLREIDAEHGLDLVEAGFDHVGFLLRQPPKGKEGQALKRRLKMLCPSLEALPSGRLTGLVRLWWD